MNGGDPEMFFKTVIGDIIIQSNERYIFKTVFKSFF